MSNLFLDIGVSLLSVVQEILQEKLNNYESDLCSGALQSEKMKARLIFYPQLVNSNQSWGSVHKDYSLITLLTKPVYFNEQEHFKNRSESGL